MKKAYILSALCLIFLIVTAAVFSQDLPQLIGNIPDPAEVLGKYGKPYKDNWQYKGKSFSTYLYDLPEAEEEFLKAYTELAEDEGFLVEKTDTDGVPSLRLSVPLMDDEALLLYNYKGYMLLMVPESIPFSPGSEAGTENEDPEGLSAADDADLPMSADEANQLGDRYANGDGVEQNYAEAVKYYRIAAEMGDPEGQCNLGKSYLDGKGIKQDYDQAVKWFRLAADQGYARGQNNLGVMYGNGNGVKQDYKEAIKWIRLAAEQDYMYAQYNLGNYYHYGRGVKQDDTEASKWYRLAANQGHVDAQSNLGFLYNNGLGVKQDYAEALKWYRLAADQGNAWAQNNIGTAYFNGEGVKQDYKEALYWYNLAADQGNSLAQYNLSLCYMYGYGVTQNYEETAKWLLASANQGYAEAQNNLGVLYRNGWGVRKDLNEARKWFELSAEQGYELAENNLKEITRDILWTATKTPKTYSGFGIIDQKSDVGTLLRDTPSPTGGILRSIMNGNQVKYLGNYRVVNGVTWVFVETQEGQQGWIMESSITPME